MSMTAAITLKTKLDALLEAQRWMLTDGMQQLGDDVPRGLGEPVKLPGRGTAHPRLPPKYWAAFELSGDWR